MTRLRQSTLKRWIACPLQAHLAETSTEVGKANAKAVFGTIIHHCIDELNNGMPVEKCVELFRELWNEPERITLKPEVWPKYTTYGGLRTKGAEIIQEYYIKNAWDSRQILASEHRFLVPFGEHELEGTVDHVEIRKGGNGHRQLRVVDFKTNGKKPTILELYLNLQFTVYLYASLQPEFWFGNGPEYPGMLDGPELWEKTQDLPRRGVWYHLMTNQEIDAGTRDDGDFMRLYRLVTQIERAREAQVFVPSIGEACQFCEFTQGCNINIPKRDESSGGAM